MIRVSPDVFFFFVGLAVPGLSCGMGQSLAGARELLVACGIWFPDQGLDQGPLLWEHGVSVTEPPGSPASGF